ncbi:c-type cytochrome [Aestuariibacter halophilus]|uniref:C-type cytochrome n=1 Tax=Fluctibacter halophilus TaxID=226011 RepID=A0ABS8G472_9ALTE|nr:c-type cytochrome [Aestuariibacter halophilus]MCC2615278.1 c-type cytochrome [Aestuariibacter halophilus]
MNKGKDVTRSDAKRLVFWRLKSLLLLLFVVVLSLALGQRFLTDEAVTYDDIEGHFKYGSIGGERNLGIPYWIWQAAPKLCPELLPHRQADDRGFESIGMIYEGDNTLPVGVSKRRHLGIDRVFLNCSVCHTSTVRASLTEERQLILGMPANRFDLMGFERFFFGCMASQKFNRANVIPLIDSMGADLDLLDKYLVYPVAIWLTQERLALLASRLSFFRQQPDWGPGRVDTFNAAKAVFNWDWSQADPAEMIGTADFPSIWYQAKRKQRDDGQPMELHWDGNNDRVEERNLSAAFGAGATPPIIDHKALGRIADWLETLPAPAYPWPIDKAKAAKGAPLYAQYCASCHGANGHDFAGARVGHVEHIDDIGTDPWRLNSYTRTLAVNQGNLYTGDERYRFKRFRKTFGYANMPLDGVWLRAPYLHNGSVPTLWDLLQPQEERPGQFYRGNDVYDQQKLGFVTDAAFVNGRPMFLFDTQITGNGNQGHSGPAFGTALSDDEKWALVEYLKQF